jgi:adhesin transport system outer membrane protein
MADPRAGSGLSSQSDGLQAQSRIAGLNATLATYEATVILRSGRISVLTGVVSDFLPIFLTR